MLRAQTKEEDEAIRSNQARTWPPPTTWPWPIATAVLKCPSCRARNPVDGHTYPTPMIRLWLLDRAAERRVDPRLIDTGAQTSSFPPALWPSSGGSRPRIRAASLKGTGPAGYETLRGRTPLVAELARRAGRRRVRFELDWPLSRIVATASPCSVAWISSRRSGSTWSSAQRGLLLEPYPDPRSSSGRDRADVCATRLQRLTRGPPARRRHARTHADSRRGRSGVTPAVRVLVTGARRVHEIRSNGLHGPT